MWTFPLLVPSVAACVCDGWSVHLWSSYGAVQWPSYGWPHFAVFCDGWAVHVWLGYGAVQWPGYGRPHFAVFGEQLLWVHNLSTWLRVAFVVEELVAKSFAAAVGCFWDHCWNFFILFYFYFLSGSCLFSGFSHVLRIGLKKEDFVSFRGCSCVCGCLTIDASVFVRAVLYLLPMVFSMIFVAGPC